MNKLLALCANPYGGKKQAEEAAEILSGLNNWKDLIEEANSHGFSPLLYYRLKSDAPTVTPADLLQQLHVEYKRQSYRNMILHLELEKILYSFRMHAIDAVVLKGGALMHLLYSWPALRPMRDLDILIKPQKALHAQRILEDSGFLKYPEKPGDIKPHHLPPLVKKEKGVVVSVELHREILSRLAQAKMRWQDIKRPFLSFNVGREKALCLGYEDLLNHLCRHLIINNSIRLINISDIIGIAEKFHEKIDWGFIKNYYPNVIETLRTINWLTPLSDKTKKVTGINKGKPPKGIGVDYRGWPYRALTEFKNTPGGLWMFFDHTFCPSEWWLCLKYGFQQEGFWKYGKYVKHLRYLLDIIILRLWGKITSLRPCCRGVDLKAVIWRAKETSEF